jgi:hypothetical protein
LSATAAHAATIDQVQSLINASTGFQTGQTDIAQTFTVGINGQLDSINILTSNAGDPMALFLLQTSSGLPTTLIASAVAGTTGNVAPVTFDFLASHVMVTVGEVLAFEPIVIGVGSEVGIETAFRLEPDPYTRGELFYRQNTCPQGYSCPPLTNGAWDPIIAQAPNTDFNFADMTFETTVDATPLPASWPLFASGLALMGWLAWRRKSALL